MKPMFKAPGIKRLKLKYHEPLSNFAFNFVLHRYILGKQIGDSLGRFSWAKQRFGDPIEITVKVLDEVRRCRLTVSNSG
jgi:hypothetical protein